VHLHEPHFPLSRSINRAQHEKEPDPVVSQTLQQTQKLQQLNEIFVQRRHRRSIRQESSSGCGARGSGYTVSHCGNTWLVGSNAYNMVENLELKNDIDFSTDNRVVVMNMPHKTRPGVSGDVHTATIRIGGISIDISTLGGIDFEEDMANRSCITSAIEIYLDGNHRIVSHTKARRIIPEFEDAHAWIRRMLHAKGSERVIKFWQKTV
jgi:hypothetical protein